VFLFLLVGCGGGGGGGGGGVVGWQSIIRRFSLFVWECWNLIPSKYQILTL